jgi:hypothetical protein
MHAWATPIGVTGIILLNMVFLNIRLFARSHGLKVRWSSRSYAPEREHLRMLLRSEDSAVARWARIYLRAEILGWILFLPFAGMFFWGMSK